MRGVDEPWDVSLVRLFWEVVNRSAKKNIREMAEKHLFDQGAAAALAPDARQEIEEAFAAAAKDRSLVKRLGALLQRHGVFSAYEERFFALMKE